jgi:hypothetical protein
MKGCSATIAALLLSVCACTTGNGVIGPPGLAGEAATGRSGVVAIEEPWIEGCGNRCFNAYEKFISNHSHHARKLSEARLNEILAEAYSLPGPYPAGLNGAELRERIIEALNIRFLLEEIDRRVLAVAKLEEEPIKDGRIVRRRLLFWDAAVGTFEGTLLLPEGEGPHPAIIGLHGHRHDDMIFSRKFLGEQLALRGFVVMIPRLRLHDCSLTETDLSYKLLRNGFTLMGMRIYETLLMIKYLDSLEQADDRHVGLLGHSGGSSIANLVARLEERVGAVVVDNYIEYRNHCRYRIKDVHCETVPELVPIAADINEPGTLGHPTMRVEYNFENDATRYKILRFFEENLRGADVAVD